MKTFPPSRRARTSAFDDSRQRSPVNEIERAYPCKLTYFVSTGDELSETVARTMPPRYLGRKPTTTRGSSVTLHCASVRLCGILSRWPRFSAEMTISISRGAVVENPRSRLHALGQHPGLYSRDGGSSSSRIAEQSRVHESRRRHTGTRSHDFHVSLQLRFER